MSHARELLRHLQRSPYDSDVAGGLYSLKMDLLAADTPLGAATAFAELLGGSAAAGSMGFQPLHAYARDHDAIIGIAYPGGQGVIRMPMVRGQDRGPATPVSHRPVAVIRLEDAWITGRSGMIRVGDTLLSDHHADELAACPVDYRFDPLVFEQNSDAAVAVLCPEGGPPLDEAISLVGCTSYNFGHWLLEYVFRYFVLRTQGLADGVPLLIDAGLARGQRDALQLYTQGRHPIIEVEALTSRRVRRLWVPTNLYFCPIMPLPGGPLTLEYVSSPPSYAARLCRAMAASIEPVPGTPKRVYLARSLSLHRKLLNQSDIMDVCRSAGFEIIYPEEHDYRYQVSLALNADAIIGPEGSAMLLAMHARPGARVLVLNHPFLENLPNLTHTLEELGVYAEVLPGECVRLSPDYRKFSDYEIAPNDLRRRLAEWALSSRAPGDVPAETAPPSAVAGDTATPAGSPESAPKRASLLRRLTGWVVGR